MTTASRFIAYYRVSTRGQAASGLGLDAQRTSCEALVAQRGGVIAETFTETESGKRDDRPKLRKALQLCRLTGSTLIIAKLDRLSRNAAFLLTLRDSGARFIAADMPDACELTVGILALVAQQERQAISSRTKAALQAAKARGQVLGNPNGAASLRRAKKGNEAALRAVRCEADRFAERLRETVAELRQAGVTTLGGIVSSLNAGGILTPRGSRWTRAGVSRLLDRLGR
ncbi:recombinase family protein [Stenotrophomonas aracearum]|uniref:recombinase family protein n=1 Tax=Stenotrophomonas aracearum TaxID=3003272 RepID=UPI003CCD3F0B